jgi:hypothetical protein
VHFQHLGRWRCPGRHGGGVRGLRLHESGWADSLQGLLRRESGLLTGGTSCRKRAAAADLPEEASSSFIDSSHHRLLVMPRRMRDLPGAAFPGTRGAGGFSAVNEMVRVGPRVRKEVRARRSWRRPDAALCIEPM